ncbi:dienelactone hydrolase family protein [Sneathiella limimaris]|uniref:dienelactone hydrolase family protein n=1 Tax=Sneathiella limimaris TaxID=1964213 RepID=UPI00146AB2AC|nr:dienelactone hydrolase family protein [Sneathiella limimaris]
MHARRDILKTAAAVPLATVLSSPMLAKAAAATLSEVTLKLDDGTPVSATVAYPEVEVAPTVLLIHEWWGLNDQIKSVAAELGKMGYVALAVDLYGGKVAKTPDEARANMQAVQAPVATETLVKWMEWLRLHERSTGKVATVGWCFGGGWSLNASIASPADGTIIYYGNVTREAAALKSLKGPVLGHFATKDQWINEKMVNGFVTEMEKAGQPAPDIHWYEADHAFANPSGGRYDEEDAMLSWQRTTDFLKKTIG